MKEVMLLEYEKRPFSLHYVNNVNLLSPYNPEFYKQIKLDMVYLTMSKVWSTMSKCKRAQVGALLVKDSTIISDGFNGTVSGMDNCCEDDKGDTFWHVLHAESNVITKLSKNAVSGEDSTLYVTMSPCRDCSKLIIQSGIKRVVFMTAYRNLEGLEFLQNNNISISYYFDLNPLISYNSDNVNLSNLLNKEQFIETIQTKIQTV